ncbi:diaminopimelate decarboxylase [Corynebacterium sp. ES2794-CONJ1]|uniref:diaminopimelate decarboxylase n=1 Tax=unclassified Corynebacterium TaxID=2624378 RepID=UPI00216817F3|nr:MULTISPECIES: diaminopimelate decarboxylase [unclassified Corynebacterium]MCS4489835.1 diaminopimelate decarboxylase [Corynebacterium sp. ES2775-CONJ]MCS4491801.1 diaminopimelate decarboxylase [Corynebacterium sp. ES2715-CONJ3]MCS4531906.1 diaminopimelate decarboxylase [Corynebacterium sp. ES2730-CONJ]MCU9519307.1 diaminopimelate decarboxylase [Corynebacterium sp. ES2794-CONJ1]
MNFNDLPAHIWPRNACRSADGGVTIAGVPLAAIAAEFGTPTFVVDEDDFRSRCRDMAKAFGGGEHVHYAAKAFLTTRIAQWVASEGLALDIASHGELQVALRAGFPPALIAAHGNNKDAAFLGDIVANDIGHVIVDSHQEIEELQDIAASLDKVQDVMVRVKPGIDAHTHEFIATAHEDQKFGFSLYSGSAYRAARRIVELENLNLVGLHCHVGSQVFDAEGFSLAAERVLKLYGRILKELSVGRDFSILDLGGGYGIAYTESETALDVDAVAKDLLRRVADYAHREDVPMPFVMVEPGRAIAGPSTVTLYTVGTVKDVSLDGGYSRRYISVDGGMSDNIRPALYEAIYDIRKVDGFSSAPTVDARVVGSHCESGDIVVNHAQIPTDIARGDLVATAATGAYCYSMSSRYNMLMRPAIVSVKDGQAQLMVRRETIEDFLNLEENDNTSA